jgi:serine/threonine-protein kinase
MPPKEPASVKTPKKAGTSQQSTGLGSVGKALGVAAAACSLATGCPGPQVRPTPLPEPCPPGAIKAMDELGIDVGDEGVATFFFTAKGAQVTTVTEGMVNVRYQLDLGDLPQNSTLSGRLIFGERVYGRLTQARSPDGKINVPVCLEIESTSGGRGLPDKGERGPNTAQVLSHFDVRAVKEFE